MEMSKHLKNCEHLLFDFSTTATTAPDPNKTFNVNLFKNYYTVNYLKPIIGCTI